MRGCFGDMCNLLTFLFAVSRFYLLGREEAGLWLSGAVVRIGLKSGELVRGVCDGGQKRALKCSALIDLMSCDIATG